jgi:hypothetical protein
MGSFEAAFTLRVKRWPASVRQYLLIATHAMTLIRLLVCFLVNTLWAIDRRSCSRRWGSRSSTPANCSEHMFATLRRLGCLLHPFGQNSGQHVTQRPLPGNNSDMADDGGEHVYRHAADRRHTPMGDARERAVPCVLCGRANWNIDAVCDSCDRRLQADQRGA